MRFRIVKFFGHVKMIQVQASPAMFMHHIVVTLTKKVIKEINKENRFSIEF